MRTKILLTAFAAAAFAFTSCDNDGPKDQAMDRNDSIIEQRTDDGNMLNGNDIESEQKKDSDFLVKAMHHSLNEVRISQIVMDRTQNAQVKSLALSMVEDHTKLNKQLEDLAKDLNYTVPQGTEHDNSIGSTDWTRTERDELDEKYLSEMKDHHEDAIDLFTEATEEGHNPKVSALARETLPTLRKHLSEVERVKEMRKNS